MNTTSAVGRRPVHPKGWIPRGIRASDEDYALANQLAADEIAAEGHPDASSASIIYSKALRFYFEHRSSMTDNGTTPTNGHAAPE